MARYEREGQVAGVFIAPYRDTLISVRQPLVKVTMEGFAGDKHAGLTRLAGVREKHIPKGTEIKNDRQVSLVDEHELQRIAHELGIQRILAEELGANVLLRSIADLTTSIPAESRLIFSRNSGDFSPDAELIVSGENLPCMRAGRVIEANNPEQTKAAEFVKAAMQKRGLVAYVDRPGEIHENDNVRIELPVQRSYSLPNIRTDHE